MGPRDKSKNKKDTTDPNEKDNDPRGVEANANVNEKDSEQLEQHDKTEANMERILREIRDFRHENSRQMGDIKEELKKTNRRIGEVEDRVEEAESRLLTMERALRTVLKVHSQQQEKLVDQEGRAIKEQGK